MRFFRIVPVAACIGLAYIPGYWAQTHPVPAPEPVLLIETARLAISHENYELALMISDQAIAEAPQSAHALHLRGKVHFALKDYKNAAADFFKAHSLFNSAAKASFEIYQTTSAAGRHAAAAEALDRYVELTKSVAAAMDELAQADAEGAKPIADGASAPGMTARSGRLDEVVGQRRLGTATR